MKKRAFLGLLGAGLFFAPIARAQIITATPNPVSPYAAASMFGTGADGAVTISSGTTTLTRDMQYSNLTLSGAGTVNTNGFRIFVSGTLDISASAAGAIVGPANSGVSRSIGAGMGPSLGVAGGTGIGAAGLPGNHSINGFAIGGDVGASGAGGSALAGVTLGGAAGAAQASYLRYNFLITTPTIQLIFYQSGNQALWPILGGLGGGSGGAGAGDGTSAGGSSGAGGRGGTLIAIYGRFIQRGTNTNTSIIQCTGSSGGAAGNAAGGNAGGAGGSAGGGGGMVYIVAEAMLGSTIVNAIDVSGGAGSAGGNGLGTGTGGNGGSGGNGGNVQVLVLSPPSFTASAFNVAGTAGSTTVTVTGAAGGAGATVRSNF